MKLPAATLLLGSTVHASHVRQKLDPLDVLPAKLQDAATLHHPDRLAQLHRSLQTGNNDDDVCSLIEQTFYNQVTCDCNPNFWAGSVDFTCRTTERLVVAPLSFRPSYTGVFTFELAELNFVFTAGICAEALGVDTEEFGFLNLGNFCFGLDYGVRWSAEEGLQTGIDSCTVQGGFFVQCQSCMPCTTADGVAGLVLDCDNAEQGVECLPMALPLSTGTEEIEAAAMLDHLDLDRAVDAAIESKQKNDQIRDEQESLFPKTLFK